MPKQPININFGQGLDTKTDPIQVAIGKFLSLQNTVFDKGGLLQKRNGYQNLPALPDNTSTVVTTFNGALTAIGNKLEAFSSGSDTWTNRGAIQPVQLETLPLIRSNLNQSQCDAAVSTNGLVCTVYTDQDPANLANNIFRYVVADVVTGQIVVAPTTLSTADPTFGTPRVFFLNNYFIVMFTTEVVSTYHLQYVAINSIVPTLVTAPVNISSSYTPAAPLAFDAAILPNNGALYIAWNGAAASGINLVILEPNLTLTASVNRDATHAATMVSVTTDSVNQTIWVSYYDSATSNGYTLAVDKNLNSVLAPTQIITALVVQNITSSAVGGLNSIFYEVSHVYSYDASIPRNFVGTITQTQGGVTGTPTGLLYSVGLASKSFFVGTTIYMLTEYLSNFQPTYFLIDQNANVIAKLAYENAGGNVATVVSGPTGYLPNGLPQVTVTGDEVQIPYLFKDLIAAVNKNTNVGATSQTAGIYSQTGINLASFTIGGSVITSEIGSNLNITGGFLWGYDGYTPVENNFFVYPDYVEAVTATTGGSIPAQVYFYQATYEWTDNQGNAFRSAPSIPFKVTTMGSTSTNTIFVPNLALTYKLNPDNPVKLVVYRWSTAQPIYYQLTSITMPYLNVGNNAGDSTFITDTFTDADILGNNIIYTNGGVVEDIGPPACSTLTLFDDRLWLVDAEDRNLLWFSKQVIEGTPVEMSDLFTFYVAPTTSAQGSTGPITALSAMDDKLIVFKQNAIYYINGTGPDNTGANNQYSQPIFITSTVGCSNQNSIVFMPEGLMFQSDKGIWLLGRNLSTTYIGAAVEEFNSDLVQSSLNIPGTNQVRFTLNSGQTLMYDYYFGQWGTFVGVPAVSSTLYQGLHTFINKYGAVLQETPDLYLDGTNPVLINFVTGWINLAGIQDYQRLHEFAFLGTYFSPYQLAISVAYDYGSPAHQVLYTPKNFSAAYGNDPLYGDFSPYGGMGNVVPFRVHAKRQLCRSFQINAQEVYDPSFGVAAGAGFSLSGIVFVATFKKGYHPISGSNSVG